MLLNEIVSADASDTDPALYELLLKLRKGATAAFTAKKTAQVLSLFPGWTMDKTTLVKPSDETRSLNISAEVPYHYPAYTLGSKEYPARSGVHTVSLHAHAEATDGNKTRLTATAFGGEVEAKMLRAELAKYEVAELPDAKKAKAGVNYIMNISDPFQQMTRDELTWMFSFDLFRKCSGYRITAPDGQTFDVVGPVQVLGFGGTQDFAAFFTWALANTNLEEDINAKLGLNKFVKAADRPRVPVGGQTIGTCAICARSQVVRNGKMVDHGYQRPGHGYLIGECFGARRDPYETSASACIEYVPHLEDTRLKFEQRLTDLRSGKIAAFVETKHNWRSNRVEKVTVSKGEPRFDQMMKAEIANIGQQIKYVTADITAMKARITDWSAGTLRRNEG